MSRRHPLERFPRPGVTVDVAVLTIGGTCDTTDSSTTGARPTLQVLVQDRTDPDGRALPGGFIRERHTVAQTVDDVLRRKVCVDPDGTSGGIAPPRLLRVFDDPDRDDRTWAISVAHSVSVREADLLGANGDLVDVSPDGRLDGEPPLLFDHDEIVRAAVEALRSRYEFRHRYADVPPDPDGFLPEPFTLHQLRRVHEAVVGTELHKDNFNRRMTPSLEPLMHRGEPVRSAALRGRPATLYRKKPV